MTGKNDFPEHNFKIVLQFREDISIKSSFLKAFVPHFTKAERLQYQAVVQRYFEEYSSFKEPSQLLLLSDKSIKTDKAKFGKNYRTQLNTQVTNLLEGLHKLGVKLEYAFRYNDLPAFNGLFERIDDYKPEARKAFKFKNFHNFFVIHFYLPPCNYCTEQYEIDFLKKLSETLLFLESFLPKDKKSQIHLLEVLYYKSHSDLTAKKKDNSQNDVKKTYSTRYNLPNSGYLKEMGINDSINEYEGEGVTIVDIEFGCYFGHKSLNNTLQTNEYLQVFPKWNGNHQRPQSMIPSWVEKSGNLNNDPALDHGTSVLGILKQKASKGIVPKVNFALSSVKTDDVNGSRWADEEAVSAAITYLQESPGNIILIEIASKSHNNSYPLESQPLVYFLFQIAIYLDIIIIEAAGNTNEDISKRPNPDLKQSDPTTVSFVEKHIKNLCNINPKYVSVLLEFENFQRKSPIFHDDFWAKTSLGTILVGATQLNKNCKLLRSNYDSTAEKVQVYAVGECIATIGYDDTGEKEINNFGHTSGAAAIIAGMAASLQSYAKKQGTLITPSEMLALLKNGDEILENNTRIGNRPSLKRMEQEYKKKISNTNS